MEANCPKEYRSESVNVFGIQVIPDLAVAVESATSINVDVLTTKLEESGCVLKDLLEGVGLPIVRVVREEDVALNVQVDMLQEREIQCRANEVGLVGWKDDMTAMVAFMKSSQDIL